MDEVAITIEGPRNWPGSLAAEKVSKLVYAALERTAYISVGEPEGIDEGFIGIVVVVDPELNVEEVE